MCFNLNNECTYSASGLLAATLTGDKWYFFSRFTVYLISIKKNTPTFRLNQRFSIKSQLSPIVMTTCAYDFLQLQREFIFWSNPHFRLVCHLFPARQNRLLQRQRRREYAKVLLCGFIEFTRQEHTRLASPPWPQTSSVASDRTGSASCSHALSRWERSAAHPRHTPVTLYLTDRTRPLPLSISLSSSIYIQHIHIYNQQQKHCWCLHWWPNSREKCSNLKNNQQRQVSGSRESNMLLVTTRDR